MNTEVQARVRPQDGSTKQLENTDERRFSSDRKGGGYINKDNKLFPTPEC